MSEELFAAETLVFCKAANCTKLAYANALCKRHWNANLQANEPKCRLLKGCKRPARELGLCAMHYSDFLERTHRERLDEFGFDVERPQWQWEGDEKFLAEMQESHEV
jgi:hypothetical protein